ncbi:hypothetical protein [Endozoicomonas sp. 4G]|uniref:hypothetical protein n=1 Tax=Endozoicomonas sp. 4G TaxID=2872754 RepID=UPI0020790979|nr:hypothetical protein [Endozoicomonas sp. 4G]
MDKLTIQIDQNHNNRLKLMVSGDQVSEEINLLIDAETDVQWDLETITTVCSHFEEAKVYSLFHGETLKAVNRAIENAMLGSTTERMVFSPSLTDVVNSQKGAAVISLSSSQNNPVSRLVYSDHDLFSHHQGFLLLTDSSQHSEDLFSLALSTTSDKLAMGISAQKIWQQHHIKDLMSLLQMGTGHLFYHSMNSHLARSSSAGSAPSTQQSDSFKNSLNSVPESTELSNGLVKPGFLSASTDTSKEVIKADKWSFHKELYNLHEKFLNRFALFMLEPSADGASPSKKIRQDQTRYPRQSAVDKNIKYGDKFIQVKDVFDEGVLEKVNREIDKDRRLFDLDLINEVFDSIFSTFEKQIAKSDIFDCTYIRFESFIEPENSNIVYSYLLHGLDGYLVCQFDENGKIKAKEAFKRTLQTRSEAVKELCCQALEKMAVLLDWSGNEVARIKIYINRYPLFNPVRFKGLSFTPQNIKNMHWHRDQEEGSLVVQLNEHDCETEYSGGGLEIAQCLASDPFMTPLEGTKEENPYEKNGGYAFTNEMTLIHRSQDIEFKGINDEKEVAEKRIIVVVGSKLRP